jgi:hypothetical protein
MPVVGVLAEGSESGSERVLAALRQGLAEAGYVEGKNLVIVNRLPTSD